VAPLLIALALSALMVLGPAASIGTATTPRASLLDVENQVMCVSCHEPLYEVSSPQALSEKAYIQGLIDQGYDKQQIIHALVVQYGVAVLARPPASGFNLLIYILPPAILAAGIAFLLLTLPRWRARGAAAHPEEAGPPLSAEDAERINEDLARLI
jgi:cytochrome c-type biogenesis protein CcmH/NrfF